MRVHSLALTLTAGALFAAAGAERFPTSLYDRLEWRMIGPFRGGRVISVAGIPGDARNFYFGSVGGGVWKTTNAGTVWSPIFDEQHIASIGAIAVAPSSPETVYVGSGEADMRSQIGFGDGVYKSVDGGRTWRNIGLRDTRQIARIVVDPRNAERVYVAALGHAYGPNAERGVFRSADGGETWQKVLDKGPEIGAADLALDPRNAQVLYATVWNARRPPWSQYPPLEGPGSGLYKSTDGGDHWSELRGHGLPESTWGRSGIAVAPGGRRVYALVDALGAGGLYRSDDGGGTWTRSSSDARIVSRVWYFSGITVDPNNPDAVYVPNVALYRSMDGGRNFTVLKGAPGGDDYHILWIDPTDSRRMILGSDQGTNISVDGGATWSTWYNQPTAQMYHVITDNQFPYVVYGSQQDSGTAAVASRTDHGEIDARDWFSVGGAESGYIAIDPKNPNIFYVGNTAGSLARFDRRTGQAQNITPWPLRSGGPTGNISQQKYRFPWTAPLVFSASEPGVLYYAAQYLLETTDGGLNWHEISPDLTGDTLKDKNGTDGAVTVANAKSRGYGVIYAIAPSPLKAGLIWVGTDTGLLHLTRDGGKTWENVTPKGLEEWSKVSQIEASHFDPAVAYASVERHRMEDYKPYVYRTRDYGRSWQPVSNGLAEPSYVNGIREDPARKGLLYAACELGVAVSFDDGDHWQSLQLNLPVASVRDLEIHGDDLVIATHGRGFWILDDIAPLRQVDEKVAAAPAWLYTPATAVRMNPETFFGTPFPPEEPKAKNPPAGAMLDYFFQSAPQGEVTLEILDARNQAVRRYSSKDRASAPPRPGAIADIWLAEPPRLTTRAGMNRFVWDLRYGLSGASGEDEFGFGRPPQGPHVLPGTYTVRLTADGRTYTQPLKVVLDPRSTASPADLSKQLDLSLSVIREIARAVGALGEARALRGQLAARRKEAEASSNAALADRIAALDGEAARFAAGGGGRGGRGGGGTGFGAVTAALNTALSVAQSGDRTPPAQAYAVFEQARHDLENQLAAWKTLRETRLADLNRELRQNRLAAIALN